MRKMNSRELSLAEQQSRLVTLIFDAAARGGPMKRGQGIDVYRRNLLAVATAALSVTYPTVQRVLGQTAFAALAGELLALHPPDRGDWGEWGDQFPRLIGNSAKGEQFPFVAPVAELDWLRHRADRAADNRFDASTASLLEAHPIDEVGIALARHVGVISSVFPLVEIFDWHAAPAASGANLKVAGTPRPMLVYRPEFRVEQRYIDPVDYAFLLGLRAGRPIGSLLDELTSEGFDFPAWLEQAIEFNIIHRFYLI
ncbi:putative DNA-binding domain-containing protein [Pseudohaliea sp.]|uniref:HvfC/BufC family peptide modification chaperone n=1 Tax=Pseudohaliea sp. TaxID=2740289 RepID=UPI0032EEDE55